MEGLRSAGLPRLVSVKSDKWEAFIINVWRAAFSIQCEVGSVQVKTQVFLQVQVQYIVYAVVCSLQSALWCLPKMKI